MHRQAERALVRRFVVAVLGAACLLGGAGAALSAQAKLDLQASAGVSAVVQTAEVRAELVAFAPQGLGLGRSIEVGLLLQHQPGWHTYWKNPGDSGLPTELHWALPQGLQAEPLAWPTPTKIRLGRLANFGYEGTVLLPSSVHIASDFRPTPGANDVVLRLNASWLVCRTECIPQDGDFALRLPVQGSTALHSALFERARSARAQPLAGKLQARIDGDSLLLRADNLPSAWQGKALDVFPETINVLSATGSAQASDPVNTSNDAQATPQAGTQQWQAAVWSARLPLSPQRTDSPEQLTFVLGVDGQSRQGMAEVLSNWPAHTSAPPIAAVPSSLAGGGQPAPPTDTAGLVWALTAAFLGGLILNLMPCVFPVLAIKVLGFASQPDPKEVSRRLIGLAYTAGVVVSMAALGGALLALRATGEQLGWGFQLQSPAMVVALALLFTLIALNLVGWLELGNLLPGALGGLRLRHPAADAALSGVLAVAVASPCTAPFMGASLGLALTLPNWQAMGIFVALGLGLALPFALASALPQLARWMPKPGVWMLHLRQFMAFPMSATVLWLLWVLGHMGGLDAAASLAALLLCVVLTAWALSLPGRSRWMFTGLSLLLWVLLLPLLSPQVLQTRPIQRTSGGQDSLPSEAPSRSWQTWSAQLVESELANGHPVFVDFTAAWCITCQYNKQTTLSDASLLKDLATKRVSLLRADWTLRDPAITEALAQLGRSGVPAYVLYRVGKAPLVMSEILTVSDMRDALNAM